MQITYTKLSDRLVTGALIFLILFSPLAFGSVHPWAFALMEVILFLLVIVWAIRVLITNSGAQEVVDAEPAVFPLARKLAIPLAFFFAVVLLQLLPLPPGLLRVLSPGTFEVYSRSLPGWPGALPDDTVVQGQKSAQQPAPVLLPTAEEARAGVPIPFDDQKSEIGDPTSESRLLTSGAGSLFPATWRSLSLAPSRTRSDLLKMVAYAALFFLVLLYPFASESVQRQSAGFTVRGPDERGAGLFRSNYDRRSGRSMSFVGIGLTVIILSGLTIAALGFIQRFSWNGKILWFFVPYDWGVARAGGDPRASGPFVNPDHFANYLALVFPLALGLVFRARSIVGQQLAVPVKILGGLTAFVIFSSILLSLSRSGWMTVCLSIALLLWLSPSRLDEAAGRLSARGKKLVLRGALVAFAILVIGSLLFVGPAGRQQVDTRLQETVTRDLGIAGRVDLWTDTLTMVRDFPVLGVGLGSWQDLFQRYRGGPWSATFFREVHNDYLELLAETGAVGFLLVGWFFLIAGKTLWGYVTRHRSSDDTGSRALVSLLVAALATMTFHEFFDFSLQIPANAFLFTFLLALALRVANRREIKDSGKVFTARVSRVMPISAFALSIFLLGAALVQEMVPYPHNLTMPGNVTSAKQMVLAHPALPTPHLYLLNLLADKMPLDWQVDELRAVLWLDPSNPAVRDAYALALLRSGKRQEGLREITQSILNAPSFSAHYYLNSRLLPWLSDDEKLAVEAGFKKAVALDYPDATENLAVFFARTDRFSEQGKVYEEAATRATRADARADLTIKAAASYLQAGDASRAEPILGKAVSLAPRDARPYEMLAVKIYGPRKDAARVDKTIAEGIKNGASSFDLYLAQAEAMHKAGAPEETQKALARAGDALRGGAEQGQEPLRPYLSLSEAAQRLGFRKEAMSILLQALELRPSSSDILRRLAQLHFQQNNFDRAAYYFRRYLDLNPDASDAFYSLALAEEGQYRLAAAAEAYHRALELAPQHDGYRQRYESLKARMAENRTPDR